MAKNKNSRKKLEYLRIRRMLKECEKRKKHRLKLAACKRRT